jgi:O-succinylbenzoate synthase
MGTLESLSKLTKKDLEQIECLKFKFGKYKQDKEKDFLLSLPQKIKLRIDANQTLEKPIPEYFSKLNIEYLEEPFKDITLYQDLTLPFALDENRSSWKDINNEKFVGIVTKPSVELSFSGTYALAKEASLDGIKTIVSSAYETTIGLNALSVFAQILDQEFSPIHHGLDGLDWFETV